MLGNPPRDSEVCWADEFSGLDRPEMPRVGLGNLDPQLAPSAFFLSSRTCTGDLARPELPSLRACCPRNHGRGNRLLTEAGAVSLEARKLASSGHWTLPDLCTLSGGGKSHHALV